TSKPDWSSDVCSSDLYYQSFDREWLKEMVHANTPVASLLLKNWPDLVIESLNVPEELSLLIGWTQSPASTENLVGQLLERSNPSDDVFKSFLKSAMTSVERIDRKSVV